MKKYSAILLDVDGTLVPVGPNTSPTDRVTGAIHDVLSKIHVSLVTGRPVAWLTPLFEILKLKDPCIINGGTQIVDPRSGSVLWQKGLDPEVVLGIISLAKERGSRILVNDSGSEIEDPTSFEFSNPLAMQIQHIDKATADEYRTTLTSRYPGIAVHEIYSWKSGLFDVYITDGQATKSFAAHKLAEILGIDPVSMIGVGDGQNDIPLLEACGLRVAMGNAHPDLKSVAHYVAPSIDEDGVAEVISRFIKSPNAA